MLFYNYCVFYQLLDLSTVISGHHRSRGTQPQGNVSIYEICEFYKKINEKRLHNSAADRCFCFRATVTQVVQASSGKLYRPPYNLNLEPNYYCINLKVTVNQKNSINKWYNTLSADIFHSRIKSHITHCQRYVKLALHTLTATCCTI